MRKIFILLIASLSCLSVYAENVNRNLRENKGRTSISLAGEYTYSGTHAGGASIGISQMYQWVQFGATAGLNSDGCFNIKTHVGPKIGSNFYVAPSLVLGLRQVRESCSYENSQNKDIFTYNRPAPRFTLGANLRLGYNFGKLGIFAGICYERAFSYSRSEMLAGPWVCTAKESSKHLLSAELGIAYVISDDALVSGDNCLEIGVSGGYSSMGSFASAEVLSFKRLGYKFGHSFGGFANFYLQSGNAEIGGEYNLELYPFGSNSVYNCSIGIEAAMGQYRRGWSGIASDKPNRFDTSWSVYSFGGRGSLVVKPLAFQMGIVNLSAYGNIGVVGQSSVSGIGDFGYKADASKAQFYWACGVKVAFAL